jgi:hypothetical protein
MTMPTLPARNLDRGELESLVDTIALDEQRWRDLVDFSDEKRVSRHQCGQGESAIVVLSRIFVPETGFTSRSRVNRAAEVDVLTSRSPPGATFIASQRSWAGQSRMARRGRAQRAAQRRP